MYRKLQFEDCKFSTYTYSLILNYMVRLQLQNLSKIHHYAKYLVSESVYGKVYTIS